MLATAETVLPPLAPAPAATIEETTRIADWLEQPGCRIISIIGDWSWPLHGVVTHAELVEHALGSAPVPAVDAAHRGDGTDGAGREHAADDVEPALATSSSLR